MSFYRNTSILPPSGSVLGRPRSEESARDKTGGNWTGSDLVTSATQLALAQLATRPPVSPGSAASRRLETV